MGSTQTGPMFEGGDAACAKGHYKGLNNFPCDEADYRRIIIRGNTCEDWELPGS
jgi:hypothetical protein